MSNKIQKPGALPFATPKPEKVGQPGTRRRSPGWIKARQERSERRAQDPIVQARAKDQRVKASELEAKKEKRKATTEAVDKLIKDQKKADKKTKWEKN